MESMLNTDLGSLKEANRIKKEMAEDKRGNDRHASDSQGRSSVFDNDFDAGSNMGSGMNFGRQGSQKSRRMSGLNKLRNKLKTKHAF